MVKKKVLTVFFFTRGSQWKTNATPSFHSCLTGGKIAFLSPDLWTFYGTPPASYLAAWLFQLYFFKKKYQQAN